MADYPKQQIDKYDAIAGKEGLELIGYYALAMAVTVAGVYIVGYLANSLF
jgi:hypothetical protein